MDQTTSDMDHMPFASLTVRERECLRLVKRGLESKEIAIELGISVSRVDEIVASARHKLGGVRRRRAADMLWMHEHPPHSSRGQPLGGSDPSLIGFDGSGANTPAAGTSTTAVREERPEFEALPSLPQRPDHLRYWLHDLDGPRRILVVAVTAFLIALLVIVAPLVAERLGRIGSAVYQRN